MTLTNSKKGTNAAAAPASHTKGQRDYAQLLDARPGHIIQELGWDEDADSSISETLEDAIGSELVQEDTDEICDKVLLWWRDDDGDLVDALVDAIRPLADNGAVWLLTPGAGRPGSVEPGIIAESAQLAGLVQTKAERLGRWLGSCLVQGGCKRS